METSADDVRSLRARKQYLQAPAEPEYLREVVGALGINAQRPSSMLLSLRARVHGLELNHVEEAIAKRMLVRTWAMRGTIHLLDGEDVRWMLALLGPIFLAAGKRRRGELGLSEEVAERGLRLIREALKGKEPLTRWEIMDILEERGFSLDRTSQAPIHFIRYAVLKGLVCLGPYRSNGEPTYVLLDDWLREKDRRPKEPLRELIRRYLKGYGPASPNDFAGWSGIPVTRAKEAWDYGCADEPVHQATAPGIVRLLPAFDSYILGYRDRDLVVPKGRQKDVYHGGQTAATVVMDGQVAGIWRYERRGKRMAIDVSPFKPFTRGMKSRAAEEAGDIGRFLGFPVDFEIE